MSSSSLYVLSSEPSRQSDRALAKFAEFLGVSAHVIDANAGFPPEISAASKRQFVLALSQATLRSLRPCAWFSELLDNSRYVLVHGFSSSADATELVWLTSGKLDGIDPVSPGATTYEVHANVKFADFPVSGKSFRADTGPRAVFRIGPSGEGAETYISANGRPVFGAVSRGATTLFLLAEPSLVDVDTRLSRDDTLRPWYSQLVAMAIFHRTAFGVECWTAPGIGANFIVDDPYLKSHYGFIHYGTLLGELEKVDGALTIAFVPYNHRRSDPQTIRLLQRHGDRFSIAVHGCDHTGGEFASTNEDWLVGTAGCALDRIESHARLTGMGCDNLMVFPQGRFSKRAIRALKTCGFDAVVNTSPWPVDGAPGTLTIRDFLQVAVTRFEDFPIFVRHYPKDVFDYAFDALFQKPVLAVEHHGYFRAGYGPLTSFMREVSALKGNVKWMPLGQVIARSAVFRRTAAGSLVVRHFTPRLVFRNPVDADVELRLEKAESDERLEAVLVGDQSVPFEVRDGYVHYAVRLLKGQELDVKLQYRRTARAPRRISWKYRFDASARRVLSEARDNYIARNERLLSLAQGFKRVLGK